MDVAAEKQDSFLSHDKRLCKRKKQCHLVYGTKCTLTTSSSGADTLPCTIPQDRGQSKEKCTTVVSEDV